VAAFKARYPGWFSIPATFTPYPEPGERNDSGRDMDGFGAGESLNEPNPPSSPRRFGSVDTASALRAFRRARALHASPEAALRALRDTPEAFEDRSSGALAGVEAAPPNGGRLVNYFVTDPGDAARGLGMTRSGFRRAIHLLKDALGLSGDDTLQIHIPSGDVWFNGELIGNLRDE
ncbi:MAG: hypothetical protein ABI369_13825, partial [Acetobacteraceae bacterium]